MVSGSKTANAGLTKWEKTDPVAVDDFNSMLDTIDLAIGKRMDAQLLRDITPDAENKNMYIDLSDVDFSDYLVIAVSVDSTPNIVIRLNMSYSNLSYCVDGSTVFFFPLRSASRSIQTFTTMTWNNTQNAFSLTEKFSDIEGFYIIHSETMSTSAKIRIWGVK